MQRIFILIFIIFLLPAACSSRTTVQKSASVMGTDVTITVVAPNRSEGEAAVEAGIAELRRLDAMMSLYREDSELTKVNIAAGTTPVAVSREMIEVIENAAEVSKRTDRAFDVTIGPLVVLWQMRLKEGKIPSDDEIQRVLPLVDYRNVVVDKKNSMIFLKKRGMILDLGGCAKGYAADRVAALFQKRGIKDAIIAVAGDIWVMGNREDGKPWRIGVQHPREKSRMLTALDLSDKYVSTSGDYERFVIREKKRYHHIIDPRTGKPSKGVSSVTVIGESGVFIDPLTTAFFILGPQKGMQLADKLGVEAIFVDENGAVAHTSGIVLK